MEKGIKKPADDIWQQIIDDITDTPKEGWAVDLLNALEDANSTNHSLAMLAKVIGEYTDELIRQILDSKE